MIVMIALSPLFSVGLTLLDGVSLSWYWLVLLHLLLSFLKSIRAQKWRVYLFLQIFFLWLHMPGRDQVLCSVLVHLIGYGHTRAFGLYQHHIPTASYSNQGQLPSSLGSNSSNRAGFLVVSSFARRGTFALLCLFRIATYFKSPVSPNI